MTLRQLLFLVFAATALLWGGWFWTIWTIDPEATNWLGFALFYVIFFLALVGSTSLLGIAIRAKRRPDALVYDIVSIAFRQAFLLSLLATSLFALQGQRLVSAWAVGIGFILAVAAEAYLARRDFKTHAARRHQSQQKRGNNPSFPAAFDSSVPPTFTKKELDDDQDQVI